MKPLAAEVGATQKLSEAKLQKKFKNGLCFMCDEKDGPGHKCKNKNFQVLLLEEYPKEKGWGMLYEHGLKGIVPKFTLRTR